MDLLEYAQQLVARGSSAHHSHMATLTTIIQREKPKTKPILKTEQSGQAKSQQTPKNNFYFVAGLVLIVGAVLAIGYWFGKNKREKEFDF